MLKIGQEFKNYPAACAFLGEPVLQGGAGRQAQLNVWQEAFRWEARGHKMIITHIIKPLEKREFLRGRKSKWYANSARMLLNALIKTIESNAGQKHNELIITTAEGYNIIGLCNGNFKYLKSDIEHIVSIEDRILFHRTVSDKFYSVFVTLLNTLEKYDILAWDRTYRYTYKDNEIVIIADAGQKVFIQSIIKEVLDELKIKSEYQVMANNLEGIFYPKVNAKLDLLDIHNCWKVYRIGFTEACLTSFTDYVESLESLMTAKLDINNKSIQHIENLMKRGQLMTKDYSVEPFEKLLDSTIAITT